MVSGTGNWSRRSVIQGGAGVFLAALAGCTSGSRPTGDDGTTASTTEGPANDGSSGTTTADTTDTAATADAADDWRSVELTDVETGTSFTVAGFGGRPVLVEFFAVWCPVCTNQQREVATLVDRMDDLVAISINVDPNEDAARVRDHLDSHEFDWYYAVAPASMTRALVDEFGAVVTNAPAAPVVRICADGTTALVEGRGLKSADTLETAFERC
ncbi:TlpA family protein disulfide reductase [Salinigranum salinum]|uniref:TlpA family protein disulfide reductase n=1 Tax=Salinigranum salinum TaxID=1364937 RepID=UPI0012611237|nr:redoxin family protein [Salinigranum salinum]